MCVCRSCLWNHLVLDWIFFLGRFLITGCILLLVISLFKLFISSWFTFGCLYVSTELSISSKLSVCCCYCSILLAFPPPALSIEISPFSLLILFIWVPSLFFLVSLARGLSVLFALSKNQLLDLFFVFFFNLSFHPDLYYFTPLTLIFCYCFCSPFSNSFRW